MSPVVVVWALLAVVVDVALARVAFGTLAPGMQSSLGLSVAAIGVVSAANVVGYLLGTPFAAVAMRQGARAASLQFHGLAAVGAIICALSPSLWVLIVGRVISGIGGAIGLVAAVRIALDAVEPRQRGATSALMWSGVGVGALAASLAQQQLLAPEAWRIAVFFWAAISLVVALATPRDRPAELIVNIAHPRDMTLVLVAYFGFGFAFLSYATFLSLAGAGSIGQRWIGLGSAAVLGALLATRSRRSDIGLTFALGIAALGALASTRGYAVGSFLVGLGIAATPGFATTLARERAAAGATNAAIARATFAVGAGQFSGPLIAGLAAQHVGLWIVPSIAATAYGVGACCALLDVLRPRTLEQRLEPA